MNLNMESGSILKLVFKIMKNPDKIIPAFKDVTRIIKNLPQKEIDALYEKHPKLHELIKKITKFFED